MWNSTQCIVTGTNGLDAWQWRPTQNAQILFSRGIMWSMPLATNISGAPLASPLALPSGAYTTGGATINNGVVFLNSLGSTGGSSYNSGYIIEAGYSATTGQQLWIVNKTETPFTRVDFSQTSGGIFVETNQDTAACTGYSIITGEKVWGPITLPNANPYNSIGSYYGHVANGILLPKQLRRKHLGNRIENRNHHYGKQTQTSSQATQALTPHTVYGPFGSSATPVQSQMECYS